MTFMFTCFVAAWKIFWTLIMLVLIVVGCFYLLYFVMEFIVPVLYELELSFRLKKRGRDDE